MQADDEKKGWLEQEAPFSNEIEMVILKLERIVVLVHLLGTLSNRRRRSDDGNRKHDISFETSLRMHKTL